MAYNKETGMYEGYIYKIYNDVNDKVYIGQTIRTIEERWNEHINSINRKELYNNVLYKAMRKYGVENFYINEICSFNSSCKEELVHKLDDLEKDYIKKCNCITPNGYNMTKGGEHVSINKETKVDAYYANGDLYNTYNSMAEAYKDVRYNENTDNGMSVICKCCKGELESGYGFVWRYHGDDFNKYPVTRTQEEIERINGIRPVDQYTLDGIYIKSYQSIAEVKKEFDLICITPICSCCSGKAHTAYGFVWRYKGESFDKYIMKNKNLSGVNQYSLEGLYIASYNSIADSVKKVDGCSSSGISLCCSRKLKQHKGFIWYYADDPNQPDKTKIIN